MTFDERIDECCGAAALYSLGALPPEEKSRFEQRLRSGCPLCTAELAEYAVVADQLAFSAPFKSAPPSLRQRVLDRVSSVKQSAEAKPKSEMTLVRAGESPWTPLPSPGVEIRPLLGEKTLLVRMQPGSVYPPHDHPHAEQCYMLEGTIEDADGAKASAGDYICMPRGSKHKTLRTETGALFLIAYT